jgi:CheY-like chemotaxis protein
MMMTDTIMTNVRKISGKYALIVDDEKPFTKTLVKYLAEKRPGLRVVVTLNGQTALEAVRTAVFDLIITDLRMPVMDGFTFIEHLREMKIKQPKVIVMSVLDDPDVRRRLALLEVDHVLGKPLNLPALITAINGSAPAPAPTVRRGPIFTAKAKRILHMDDNPDARMVTGLMLEESGYQVSSARNGEKAVELFSEALRNNTPFDIVILDLHVEGGMGGAEAVKLIREADPRVRVIVASGSTQDPAFTDYQAHGFDVALPKPYGQTDLEDAVRRVEEIR